jgi:hypothetical protein
MSNLQQQPSQLAALLATTQGKVIAALTIIAMLMGLVYEGIQILSSIEGYKKIRSEAITAQTRTPLGSHHSQNPCDGIADLRAHTKDAYLCRKKIRDRCAGYVDVHTGEAWGCRFQLAMLSKDLPEGDQRDAIDACLRRGSYPLSCVYQSFPFPELE